MLLMKRGVNVKQEDRVCISSSVVFLLLSLYLFYFVFMLIFTIHSLICYIVEWLERSTLCMSRRTPRDFERGSEEECQSQSAQ